MAARFTAAAPPPSRSIAAAFYPYPLNGLPAWEVMLAGMMLAGLSAVAWERRRQQPWILIGWLWYLVMLLPVLGIIQVGGQAHADRYTYLPQIGIYVAVTWLVAGWGAKRRVGRGVFWGLMFVVLAALMVCAWRQTAYWKDSETLWTHALACTTDNDVANNSLGLALSKESRVNEAVACFQQALQINPGYAPAHGSLGNILLRKGSVDEAITHYQSALQIEPGDADVQGNLGIALFQKGRVDEAIRHCQNALQISPDYADAHLNLGNAFMQKGSVGEAITQFRKAFQLEPGDPNVQYSLAWGLATCPQASLRNGDEAVQLARQANERAGGKNPIFLHTLAAAFAEAGRFGDAVSTAQKAIELAQAAGQPDLAARLNNELKRYKAGLPFLRASPCGVTLQQEEAQTAPCEVVACHLSPVTRHPVYWSLVSL